MKEIKQTYTIKAALHEVWWSLTTKEAAEQWGANPAEVDAVEGGKFSYWGGDINGAFTKIVPQQLIQQDWYGHDHPDRKFDVTFRFEEKGSETLVHLEYSGEIEDEGKDIKDWQEYYFDPIKKLLET
jgi:activator of HSP90 ATPase